MSHLSPEPPEMHERLQRSPLAGVRVLDLSRLLPGPFATLVLSDLGAQVDKIEDPGAGDYLRMMPPLVGSSARRFSCSIEASAARSSI